MKRAATRVVVALLGLVAETYIPALRGAACAVTALSLVSQSGAVASRGEKLGGAPQPSIGTA